MTDSISIRLLETGFNFIHSSLFGSTSSGKFCLASPSLVCRMSSGGVRAVESVVCCRKSRKAVSFWLVPGSLPTTGLGALPLPRLMYRAGKDLRLLGQDGAHSPSEECLPAGPSPRGSCFAHLPSNSRTDRLDVSSSDLLLIIDSWSYPLPCRLLFCFVSCRLSHLCIVSSEKP
jgi:hypothetical protein